MGGWGDYVEYLRQDGICEHAHIISIDDGSIWATSSGMTVKLINFFNFSFF